MRACRELPAQLGENTYRPSPEKTRAPSSAGLWHDHPLLRILAVARLLCFLTGHILDAYAFKHMPIVLVSVAALSRTEAPVVVFATRSCGSLLTQMSYTHGLQHF